MRKLLTILTVSVLFSSCQKKDEKPNFTHGKINPNLYSYIFDTGSYWIYKDTITNSIDSTIVTSIIKDVYLYPVTGPGQGHPGDEEYFYISCLTYPANTVSYDVLMLSEIGTTAPLWYGPIKYISTKNIGSTFQNAKIENIIDSLSVEGEMYYNVIKMQSLPNLSSTITNYYYYVDNIGVIKKETLTGTILTGTWNLLRYNTIIKPYF